MSLWRALQQRLRRMLGNNQKTRTLMEEALHRQQRDPRLDERMRRLDGPERTGQAEYAARLAQERDELERQRQELEERNAELDRALNDDRDRNGRDDRVEDRTDRDRDGRDDATERRDEIDERNDDANDRDGDGQDDAVQRRQEERERADEERRRRDEQNRQGERDGIDPATATGAAAGAAVAADALDDERDERAQAEETPEAEQAQPGEPGESGQDVEETGERSEPAGEADNQRQAEADNEQQPSPYVTDEADRAQDPALDTRDDNALDDPSAESPSPYATDNPTLEQTTESPEPQLDSDLDTDVAADNDLDTPGLETDGAQTDVAAEQDGVNPYVADEARTAGDLAQDGVDPYVADGAPVEQGATDLGAEEPQVDPQQVGQGREAAGQDLGEAQRPSGPTTEQVAQASQTAVNETTDVAQDEQNGQPQAPEQDGQGPQSQWRPPERAAEEPVLDEARATKTTQQTGPGRDIPPQEKAVLDKTQTGQAPAHEAVSSAPAVGGGERTGRELQQAQERDRTRGNDGPGLGRG